MGFTRTVMRLKDRADVHPALKKVIFLFLFFYINCEILKWVFPEQLWKKHYEVNGLVTKHLSPFEQNIVSPLLSNLRSTIVHQLQSGFLEAAPGLGVGIAVYYYGNWKHKELARHHRV